MFDKTSLLSYTKKSLIPAGQQSYRDELKQAFPNVRISCLTYYPFSFCSNNELPGRPGVYGCSQSEPRLLHSYLDYLNLTYTYVRPSDFQYGRLLDNGTWTGHVGMILRGDADIAVGE
jgi:hypothetical protein